MKIYPMMMLLTVCVLNTSCVCDAYFYYASGKIMHQEKLLQDESDSKNVLVEIDNTYTICDDYWGVSWPNDAPQIRNLNDLYNHIAEISGIPQPRIQRAFDPTFEIDYIELQRPTNKNVNIDNKLSLYLNWIRDELYIDDLTNNSIITIDNIYGKQMVTYNTNESSMNISTYCLSPGIYTITVIDFERKRSAKFLKE